MQNFINARAIEQLNLYYISELIKIITDPLQVNEALEKRKLVEIPPGQNFDDCFDDEGALKPGFCDADNYLRIGNSVNPFFPNASDKEAVLLDAVAAYTQDRVAKQLTDESPDDMYFIMQLIRNVSNIVLKACVDSPSSRLTDIAFYLQQKESKYNPFFVSLDDEIQLKINEAKILYFKNFDKKLKAPSEIIQAIANVQFIERRTNEKEDNSTKLATEDV